jgi:AcrR family transcriptional regulator
MTRPDTGAHQGYLLLADISGYTAFRPSTGSPRASARRGRNFATGPARRSAAPAAGGPDAVRIEPLAKALDVTKGGFYWHFDDRRALLAEMLDTWERVGVDEVIERVEGEVGDARAKLRRLSAIAGSSGEGLRIDLAVRDWARRDKEVAKRLRRVDNRRMDYMRSLFGAVCADEDEIEVRCIVFYSLWIGSHFIAADHGPRSRADVLKLALRQLEA